MIFGSSSNGFWGENDDSGVARLLLVWLLAGGTPTPCHWPFLRIISQFMSSEWRLWRARSSLQGFSFPKQIMFACGIRPILFLLLASSPFSKTDLQTMKYNSASAAIIIIFTSCISSMMSSSPERKSILEVYKLRKMTRASEPRDWQWRCALRAMIMAKLNVFE